MGVDASDALDATLMPMSDNDNGKAQGSQRAEDGGSEEGRETGKEREKAHTRTASLTQKQKSPMPSFRSLDISFQSDNKSSSSSKDHTHDNSSVTGSHGNSGSISMNRNKIPHKRAGNTNTAAIQGEKILIGTVRGVIGVNGVNGVRGKRIMPSAKVNSSANNSESESKTNSNSNSTVDATAVVHVAPVPSISFEKEHALLRQIEELRNQNNLLVQREQELSQALEASSAYPSLPITPSVPQRALNISPSPSQSQSQSQSQSSSSSTLLGLPSFSTGLNTAAAHAHMHTINSSISLLPESTGVAPYGSAANTAQATHDAAAGDAGAGGSAVHAYVHPRPPALYDHSVDSVERTQRLMLQQTSSFGDEADVHENDDDCYGDDDGEAALLTTSQHSALQAMGGEMHGLATSSRFVQLLAHPNKRAVAPPSSTAGAGRQGGSASTLNTRTSAMTGMHTRRRQLLERNARHKVGSHAHPLAWLVAWIRALYDDKTRADNSARGDNLPIQPLPEFLYELQRKKYGLQNIIDQKTWDVLMAVSNFRDLSQEVELFAQFLEESRSLDEFILFLRTRHVVMSATTGVRWGGHLKDKQGNKSIDEYISLDRAHETISSVFAGSTKMQETLYNSVLQHSLLWSEMPDPLSPQQWQSMGYTPPRMSQDAFHPVGHTGGHVRMTATHTHTHAHAHLQTQEEVHPRCILMTAFLDLILAQFRAIELELRHNEMSVALFARADEDRDGKIDFQGFKHIFLHARPAFTQRQIAQMYANLVRNAGSSALTLPVFKKLAHQLMADGVVFPLLASGDKQSREICSIVGSHWTAFREVLDKMVLFLEKSAKEHDVKCASSLKNVKFLLEKEMTKTQRLDLASEQQLQRSGGGGAESQSLRLCSLYRGLLHMLLSHQSAWMLNGVQMPAPSLHKELQLMEQMVVERNRLYNHAQKQLHQGRRVHGSGQLEQPGPQHAHTHRAQGQTKESNNGLRLPRL